MDEYLFEYVTDDEYELPIITDTSASGLSRQLGLAKSSVASAIRNAEKRGTNCRYKKVYIGDDLDEVN